MFEHPPRATRLGRIADFLAVMYPPVQGLAQLLHFTAIYWSLQALAGAPEMFVTWRAVIAGATVVLLGLLFRVYDELKDVEADRRLAAAGDPRYADRPVVTGHVRVEDIVLLERVLQVLVIAGNLLLGPQPALLAFLVLFGVLWLSSKWFFAPAIADNLLLAFVTHNPLVLLIIGYVIAVFADDFGWALLDTRVLLVLFGFYTPLAAWETSRKIRIAEDETDYQTYSKVLGPKIAPLMPAGFVIIAAACIAAVLDQAGLGLPYQLGLIAVACVTLGACLLFRFAPTRARANLRPFVELFALAAFLGVAISLAVQRGVAWVAGAPWS